MTLLHRFEQGGLNPRRRAIDLVREEHVREDRPSLEERLAAAHHHGADQVGSRGVRRELHALELGPQHARHGLSQEGLRRSGRALQKDMSAGEGSQEHQLHGLLVADDGVRHFSARLGLRPNGRCRQLSGIVARQAVVAVADHHRAIAALLQHCVEPPCNVERQVLLDEVGVALRVLVHSADVVRAAVAGADGDGVRLGGG